MILSCNSCGKKFVVPDSAITQAGRLVQCSACGNKWKQFPVKISKKEVSISKPNIKKINTKTISTKKPISSKKPSIQKKKIAKKKREINLYSPEYLAKKHGIKINETETKISKSKIIKNKVSFGFYSSLLVFLIIVIFFSRALYFTQGFIINLFPDAEFYINYFFESIRNIFEIWKNLISDY